MHIGLGQSKEIASAAWRPRQAVLSSLAVTEDSFVAKNQMPAIGFGASLLKKSLWLLALSAMLGGQACKNDSTDPAEKSSIVVEIDPNFVVKGAHDPRYLEAAQGLRRHAGWLLEHKDSTGMTDVEIFSALATKAVKRSGDNTLTFVQLMNEVFFNRLPQKYRLIANLPKVRMDGPTEYFLGCDGLAPFFVDNDLRQISKHFWYCVVLSYLNGRDYAQAALIANESKWFGEDPSEADIRLGELAITIGEELRQGKPPSQINWKELLSGESNVVNP